RRSCPVGRPAPASARHRRMGRTAVILRQHLRFLIVLVATSSTALAGPYDPSSGPGTLGIPAASPLFVGWATGVSNFSPGPQNIANPTGPLANSGVSSNALGIANNTTVSLGDGGSITLTFANPIVNGAGADFAVFENGFASGSLAFLELAHVEVSSD